MIRGSVVPAFLDAGTWSACFGESFAHLLLADLAGPGRCFAAGSYLREMAGTGGIPDGRNKVCEAFLDRTEGEWLWFVDSDMGFAPDTIERLVEAADPQLRPIVGGLCFAHRRTGRTDLRAERYGIVPTMYRWVEIPGGESGFAPVSSWERGSLLKVAGTGAACLLIHRSALQAIRARAGDEWFSTLTHPSGLGDGRSRTFSEDLSFCVRAAGADLPVHVATSVQTTHHKGGVYLDEDTFRAQMALLEVPGAAPAGHVEPVTV